MGVLNNCIFCTKCKQWVHHRCSKLKKKIAQITQEEMNKYTCKKCKFEEEKGSGFVGGKEMILNGGDKCEVVDKFCYLGDTMSVGGGADAAVVTRISSGWKNFR